MNEPGKATTPNEFRLRYLRELTKMRLESGACCTATDTEGVWYVRTVGDQDIHLLDYLFNWRIVTSWVREPLLYTGGWCYAGKGWDSFTLALEQAWAFDPYRDGAPQGYVKEALPFQG